VCRQVHALAGRRDPAFDDLVQIAAEQALRALPSFRGRSELSTWTYQICYRTVLRHRRWYSRWLRRFTLDTPNADAPREEPSAVDRLGERDRARRLYAALDRLTPKRRAVVVLRDLEGLEVAEVAKVVGAGQATVRSRLRDARRDLARVLSADPHFADYSAYPSGTRTEEEP
jgi:RNA polymerase sigma-70 factor (ECF subfamily)